MWQCVFVTAATQKVILYMDFNEDFQEMLIKGQGADDYILEMFQISEDL